MTLFLFFKQIVDMFYSYQALDYAMVVFVVLLCLYQLALVRPSFKRLQPVDGLVALLAIMFSVSFLRNTNGYQNYFKVLSACLIYYCGRLYSERIKECYKSLVLASYFVVYMNFFHRIFRQGFKIFTGLNEAGEFFYYKTDLAFAMILASIFLYFLARRSILKYITLMLVIPYMVLYSSARTQQVLIFLIYFIFVLAHREKNFDGVTKLNWKFVVSMTGMLFLGVVALLIAPYMNFFQKFGMKWGLNISNGILTEANMQNRYYAWRDIILGFVKQPIGKQLFGIDFVSDVTFNNDGSIAQSMYIKTLFSIGYIGCILVIVLICAFIINLRKLDQDRQTFYLSIAVGALFLGSGLTVSAHEFTQMSWFPMMFFGMVVTGLQPEDEEEMEEVRALERQ